MTSRFKHFDCTNCHTQPMRVFVRSGRKMAVFARRRVTGIAITQPVLSRCRALEARAYDASANGLDAHGGFYSDMR